MIIILLLMADVFENLRKNEIYKIYPAYFLSAPSLALPSLLKIDRNRIRNINCHWYTTLGRKKNKK